MSISDKPRIKMETRVLITFLSIFRLSQTIISIIQNVVKLIVVIYNCVFYFVCDSVYEI